MGASARIKAANKSCRARNSAGLQPSGTSSLKPQGRLKDITFGEGAGSLQAPHDATPSSSLLPPHLGTAGRGWGVREESPPGLPFSPSKLSPEPLLSLISSPPPPTLPPLHFSPSAPRGGPRTHPRRSAAARSLMPPRGAAAPAGGGAGLGAGAGAGTWTGAGAGGRTEGGTGRGPGGGAAPNLCPPYLLLLPDGSGGARGAAAGEGALAVVGIGLIN